MRIDILPNGPYKVSGGVPLSIVSIKRNEQKEAVGWTEERVLETSELYMLCRCGQSAKKPFCDGAHVKTGFNGTETASKAPFMENATTIKGDGITLYDNIKFCIGAEFCERKGTVWSLTQVDADAFGTTDPEEAADFVKRAQDTAIEEACLCPSGRLVMYRGDTAIEAQFDGPSIALIEDPVWKASCALWIRGEIPVFGADGQPYEVRNRVTLCRCGHSGNKPYCDGRHYSAEFNDGLLD